MKYFEVLRSTKIHLRSTKIHFTEIILQGEKYKLLH